MGNTFKRNSEAGWDNFIKSFSSSTDDSQATESDSKSVEMSSDTKVPVEISMTAPKIIQHSQYPVENHVVTTEDKYLLTLHRIPHGRNSKNVSKRSPLLLQHGVLADSSCWLLNGPDKSLPFLLADAGFDVWLGNVRGSLYSRYHKTLNANKDEKFWRFTWQHMAKYDLPAMVDYVLDKTNRKSLHYIGHSQGTLIAFASLSEIPEMNNKIKTFFALAPVSGLAHITSPLASLTTFASFVNKGLSLLGGCEILPKKKISEWISTKLHKHHKDNILGKQVTYHGSNLMMYLCGVHTDHYFRDRLPVYFSHTPAGTSLHNLVHLSQLVEAGKMQKFDFGSASENKKVYGSETPPDYDLSKIKSPLVLFVGTLDQFAVEQDCEVLMKQLTTKILLHKTIENFDHMDFLWGVSAEENVYNDLIRIILEQEKDQTKAKTEL